MIGISIKIGGEEFVINQTINPEIIADLKSMNGLDVEEELINCLGDLIKDEMRGERFKEFLRNTSTRRSTCQT